MMKKVYVEITNNCNLKCSFCIHNKREAKYMSMDEFKIILNKLKEHTKYLYFHVLGEPLIHPLINEFIDEASKDYFVNITTNGYFIEKIKNNKNIRQINISLHSNVGDVDNYLNRIFEVIDDLKKYTYINYRLWVGSNKKIIHKLEEKYCKKITKSMKLEDNVFIDIDEEFVWPDLNNQIYNEHGFCYGLKDHFGILVDGSIVPCCLDGNGCIILGNIFTSNIDEVLHSKRSQEMIVGFNKRLLVEDLCKHCGFINRNTLK